MNAISGDRWRIHFKSVLQNSDSTKTNQLPPNTTASGSLDYEITNEEINLGKYILRQGKSVGIDSISNEMIACLLLVQPALVRKLFNAILLFPMAINKWHMAMISPIHKKSSKLNPDNYRGISLLSCFSKFFSVILNKRLLKYVENERILSNAQLGFVPGNRTSDALLILHNLIDYYTRKCFVDALWTFRKPLIVSPDTFYSENC